MLSSIYIMKISDKQTVKSPNVYSPDTLGPAALIKSHPSINAYVGELSPVVVPLIFLSLCPCIEVCIIPRCVHKCKLNVT